jgi:3-dehydrosphinganine reductase
MPRAAAADPCIPEIFCSPRLTTISNFVSEVLGVDVGCLLPLTPAILISTYTGWGAWTDSEHDITMTSTALILTTALCSVVLLFVAMSFFSSKGHFPVKDRTVIITGGSQGMGLSVAQQLAAKGAHICIVAQNVPKLEAALASAQKHASSPSQRFMQLSYDLRSPESAPKILEAVTKWNNGSPPDIVWNCAGHSLPSFFADAEISTLRDQMDTVYWSAAYMAHATLNLWKKPRSDLPKSATESKLPRMLIFTCSVIPFFPLAGYTPYTIPKAAMKALVDSLRQEVAVYNGHTSTNAPSAPTHEIKLATIYPVGIESPGFANENKMKPALTRMLEEDDKPQQPDEVARIAIQGLEGGKEAITTLALGSLMHGVGMGPTPRKSVGDVFWNFVGCIAVPFVTLDFLSKCTKWGKEKAGMTGI